ncbi:MAG TPA: LytTR family DNA-binding domain-containing protein [Cyclobacteriaceae bacterium]|nr:LytTR family DNA-binding domain-containing protein [Cyclobacteriaceae bacterium]
MNILIIEDEPEAAARLATLLREIRPDVNIAGSLDSVRAAVKWVNENPSPDLFFMDIQLADGLSFEIFEKVEIKSPVIFTTAYNEYALKAFKVNSIDYILKPLDKAEVVAAFRKYENLTGQLPSRDRMTESIAIAMQMLTKRYKERFVIKVGEHLRSVEINEILYFYSLEKTTFAQAADSRKHILDYTLDQLEGLLDPARFFRINRKYIVSVASIRDMISHTNSRLKLALKSSDDDDIIVARERVQEFKDWLDK